MSTSTLETEPEAIPEPIPDRDDVTKAKRHVFNRHLAHEAIMLDRVQRQLRQAERMEKFAATGDVTDLATPEGEDDMGVSIGNEFHIHNQMPSTKTNTTSPLAAVPAAAGGIGKHLLSAVLGGGLVIAGGLLSNWWNRPPATASPPVVVDTDTDTDTTTIIDFPE